MASNDITINLLAQTKDAVKSLNAFQKDANKSLLGIQNSFASLKTVAIGALGFLGGRAILKNLKDVTNAAAIQEQAVNQLNTALKLAGDFSSDASKDIQKFASSLQQTTKIGDETVLQQFALAKAYGLTNERTKDLIKAAIDLSAATGMSLDGAVRNLGKTFSGLTGELGESIPAMRGFSQEQLKAGAAVDYVAKRFGGAASAEVNTYGGAITQLTNIHGDFKEQLGFLITQNPVVIAAIKAMSEGFIALTQSVSKNDSPVFDFVNNMVVLSAKVVPITIKAFGFLVAMYATLEEGTFKLIGGISTLIKWFLEFKIVQLVANSVADSFKTMGAVALKAFKFIADGLALIPGIADTAAQASDALQSQFESLYDTIGEPLNFDGAIGSLEVLSIQAKLAGEQSTKTFDEMGASILSAASFADGLVKKIQDVANNAKPIELGAAGGDLQNAPKESSGGGFTIGALIDGAKVAATAFSSVLNPTTISESFAPIRSLFTVEGISGAFSTVKDTISSSFESLKNIDLSTAATTAGTVISSSISAGATVASGIFSGSFLNSFTGFIQQIGQFPQALMTAFQNLDGIVGGLLDSLPGVIKSLLESIPKIAESFAQKFPELINMLVDAFPKITEALLASLPKVVQAILDAIPKIIAMIPKIVDKLAKAIPGLIRQIMKALPAIIMALAKAIPQIVKSLAEAIPEIIMAIVENIGPVIMSLVEGILTAIPQIIFALIDVFIIKGGLLKIVFGIIAAIPQIIIGFIKGVLGAVTTIGPQIMKSLAGMFGAGIKFPSIKVPEALKKPPFFDKLKDLFQKGPPFVDKLKNLFTNPPFIKKIKEIFDKFNPFGGGGGSKRGSITGIKGSPLAVGGLIPKGFPNDTFPARLTSGEFVIPPGPTRELQSFLAQQRNGGGSGGNVDTRLIERLIDKIEASSQKEVSITLQVGQAELAKVMLNLNRQGFRVA